MFAKIDVNGGKRIRNEYLKREKPACWGRRFKWNFRAGCRSTTSRATMCRDPRVALGGLNGEAQWEAKID